MCQVDRPWIEANKIEFTTAEILICYILSINPTGRKIGNKHGSLSYTSTHKHKDFHAYLQPEFLVLQSIIQPNEEFPSAFAKTKLSS